MGLWSWSGGGHLEVEILDLESVNVPKEFTCLGSTFWRVAATLSLNLRVISARKDHLDGPGAEVSIFEEWRAEQD